MTGFDFQQAGKKVLQIEQEGLAELAQYINDDFSLACEKIFHCQGRVIVMGMGKSGHIGHKIAATFASTGTPSFFVHPGEASHGDLGMVTEKDIVLAISNSGEASEILALIPVLKRKQILLICMTRSPQSTMGKAADIHLCIKVPKEACPLGLAPTTRRKLLLHVSDLMNKDDDIPRVSKEATLREALVEITRKKLGMTVICDDNMLINGIFTDGDLRRIFDLGIDLNNAKISDVMTKGGIRISPDSLAVEALNLMQAKHITSLLVTEPDSDILLGVLHMHDLLQAGVV